MNVYSVYEVRVFINALPEYAREHAYKTIELLQQYGYRLGLPQSRALGKGLFELRSRGKQEIRMLYVFHKSSAVIVHIFIKKSQKTPYYELKVARKRMELLTK